MVNLIIDSAADIGQEEADKLGITLLPMEIRFNEEEYLDGVNLKPEQFYDKLQNCTELPKTSQINPYRFEEVFERLSKNGDEAIVITISSKLSGTFANAKQAAEEFKGKVFVVDSFTACTGERLLVYYALHLIRKGCSAKEIFEKLEEVKHKVRVYAALGTLKYLKMGGRISSVVAVAGEMLSLKPLISVEDGLVKVVGKALGEKKAMAMITAFAKKKIIDFDKPFSVLYSGKDKSVAERFLNDGDDLWGEYKNEVELFNLGCTIGVHIGPGAVGVAFFEK